MRISDEQHKADLTELRSHRNKIRERNSFEIKKTEDLLKSMNVDNGAALVTFEGLKSLEIGEIQDVNDNVSFVLTSKEDNKLVFITYMLDGGSFGLQEHDCFEVVKIFKGNLFETERGYKVYTEGDTVCYAPYEKHKPYSSADSVYEVTFYKKLQ